MNINPPDSPLPPVADASADAGDAAILVVIKTHSASGHDVISEPLPNALQLIKDAVLKKGKWLYIGNKRHKYDPAKPDADKELASALRQQPAARLTGSLRGGEPTAAKVKKPKAKKAKTPKAPKAKKPKAAPTSEAPVSTLPLPPADTVQIVMKDAPFRKLGEHELVVAVFTIDKAQSRINLYPQEGSENLMKMYDNAVGTLLLKNVGKA